MAGISQGGAADFNHIAFKSQEYQKVSKGEDLLWQSSNPPSIDSFTANPDSIDLDDRPSGNIRFIWDITGSPVEWAVYKNHVRVSQSYVGNTARAQGFALIAQPTETSVYTLTARSASGSISQDVTVTVTQNPVIPSFSRTGFAQAPGLQAGTFQFTIRIVGYPMPTVHYRFGNGRQGIITARNFAPVSGEINTWEGHWSIYHSVLNDSLNLTAKNSSGSVSNAISNISS